VANLYGHQLAGPEPCIVRQTEERAIAQADEILGTAFQQCAQIEAPRRVAFDVRDSTLEAQRRRLALGHSLFLADRRQRQLD